MDPGRRPGFLGGDVAQDVLPVAAVEGGSQRQQLVEGGFTRE